MAMGGIGGLFGLTQLSFRAFALARLDRQRDEVRHGSGELFFLEGPAPGRPRVFVTDDSDRLRAEPNWGIQHRRDAV